MLTPTWHPTLLSQLGSAAVLVAMELPLMLAVLWPLRRIVKGKW